MSALRQRQLDELVAALAALTATLSRDPDGGWTLHFDRCLAQAQAMAGEALDAARLNLLAGSVMSVFGGMGSFNDYVPYRAGRLIPGMEALDAVSEQVYQAAFALRVVEGQG